MIKSDRFLKTFLHSAVIVILIYFFSVYLPQAFRGELVPNPIAFSIGIFEVRWYGILISLAVVISYYISRNIFSKSKEALSKFDDIFLITLIGGVIGARLGFVIQNIAYYKNHLFEIIKITDGGLSIHGALILGVITLFFISRIYKVNFLALANTIAPQVMLSGAIGRFGNFFNQEIIGKPFEKYFFKMFVSYAKRPEMYKASDYFHPVFLYESVLLIVFYAIYYFILRKKYKNIGIFYTLVLYSFIRISVEPFRIDYQKLFFVFDLAQLVSIGIIILTIIYYIKIKDKLDH